MREERKTAYPYRFVFLSSTSCFSISINDILQPPEIPCILTIAKCIIRRIAIVRGRSLHVWQRILSSSLRRCRCLQQGAKYILTHNGNRPCYPCSIFVAQKASWSHGSKILRNKRSGDQQQCYPTPSSIHAFLIGAHEINPHHISITAAIIVFAAQ